MTLWQNAPIESDLLAYLGWQGDAYILRKHGIERLKRNAKGQLAYAFAGAIAPPQVVAHWRRLGGCEVVTERKQVTLLEAA